MVSFFNLFLIASAVQEWAYGLVHEIRGEDFLDCSSEAKVIFETIEDPTGGVVDYSSCQNANELNLVSLASTDSVLLKVDATGESSGRGRKSVRLRSKESFSLGLFVLKAEHMPTGCGTWPAFWSVGEVWPDDGEIDIVEGSNRQTHNRSALHTSEGCIMPIGATANKLKNWSEWLPVWPSDEPALDCYAFATDDNLGCVQESREEDFGASFNDSGGGYFIMELSEEGISVWHFLLSEAPFDLRRGRPQPEEWRRKSAWFPFTDSCGISYFGKQRIVINTTFCGGYAGWSYENYGCPMTDELDSLESCEQFVRNNALEFDEAFWSIAYLRVFQKGEGKYRSEKKPLDTTGRRKAKSRKWS